MLTIQSESENMKVHKVNALKLNDDRVTMMLMQVRVRSVYRLVRNGVRSYAFEHE